jgi:hypothetical protein
MRLSLSKSLLWLAAAAAPLASAERVIESRSLNPCMANSSFSATLFNVAFTPNNRSLAFNVEGISNIDTILDPCSSKGLEGMCPMNAGPLMIKSNLDISEDLLKNIPSRYCECGAQPS